MNKIKDFAEAADPQTRKEIMDLLSEVKNENNLLNRVVLLKKLQGIIETRIGLRGRLDGDGYEDAS